MAKQMEFDLTGNSQPGPGSELKPQPNSLNLVLGLTGNPWADFGTVSFCEAFRNAPFSNKELRLMEHEAIITIENPDFERIEEWLNQIFTHRWNELFWLSRGAKILNFKWVELTRNDNDFVSLELSNRTITEEELAQIKEKWKNSPIKDSMSLTQWRFNFIGTRTDAKGLREKQSANVQDFLENWKNPVGKKVCVMSGRSSAKLKKLLQMVNPFASKHHNTKVRGVLASSINPEIGPLYYLINLCATLDEDVPFVYNPGKQVTRLILPDIPNLDLLAKVYARLRENLRDDLRDNELYPYTNLRFRLQVSNRYSLALLLFHNIFYEFMLSDEDSEETEGVWDFSPLGENLVETTRQLTRWVIIPFSKGQNVIFQNFHTVVVNHRLYDFIKPIPFVQGDIKLVPDILARMFPKSPDGENALSQLSQAIATSAPFLMKTALFNLWKHAKGVNFDLKRGAPHPVRLLLPFINHFLEENQVLEDKLRADLRALGTTIGGTFNKDVTLISKLFNISSVSAFREALNVVMFRLYKLSTGDSSKKAIPVRQERVEHILTQLKEENYKEIAETLSTYVCLSAYNANVFESKSDNEGGKDD